MGARELCDEVLARGRPGLAGLARAGYFDPQPPSAPGSVWVVACAWIGDCLWAAQVLPAVRARWPGARVVAVTRPSAQALWDLADEVRPIRHVISDRRRERGSWLGLLREARQAAAARPGLVLDLTGNRYSALFTWLARPAWSLGLGGDELGGLYSRRVTLPPGLHLAERPWRALASLLGPPPDPLPYRLPPAADRAQACRAWELDPEADLALLAPGAGWPGKCWPVERLAELAARLEAEGLTVVAVGGPGDLSACRAALARTRRGRLLLGAPLPALIAIAAGARLFVGMDSGPTHLAAAAGAPVLALFSPTNPAILRPLGPRVHVLRAGCQARPEGRGHHCHDRPAWPCPVSCWDALPVEAVWEAAGELLRTRFTAPGASRERPGPDPLLPAE